MSTDLKSRTKFQLTQYYGGDKDKLKLQVTHPSEDFAHIFRENLSGAIQLTQVEAFSLMMDLSDWLRDLEERGLVNDELKTLIAKVEQDEV